MPFRPDAWSGFLIGVAGGRGAGSSLLAMCLAQDLASDASNRGLVLLAHVAAGAGQDPMHSCPDMVTPAMVARAQVHGDDDLDGLLGAYRFVVADIEADIADVVGAEPAGAADSQLLRGRADRDASPAHTGEAVARAARERSEQERETPRPDASHPRLSAQLLTVATLLRSDLIVVVGAGDTSSLQSLVQTIEALASLVGADRVLPVVNRLPRGFRRRSAAVSETLRSLASSAAFGAGDPVLIAERDAVRRAARDGLMPPSSLVRPLSSEARLRLATASRTGSAPAPPSLSAVAGD